MSTNIRITRICEYCGQEFTAQTTRTRYCSHTCNSRDYKARKRAEKLQEAKAEVKPKTTRQRNDVTDREFLSITEACKLIGVSRWTIWRAINRGELNAGNLGRRKLLRRADIESLFLGLKKDVSADLPENEPRLESDEPAQMTGMYYTTYT